MASWVARWRPPSSSVARAIRALKVVFLQPPRKPGRSSVAPLHGRTPGRRGSGGRERGRGILPGGLAPRTPGDRQELDRRVGLARRYLDGFDRQIGSARRRAERRDLARELGLELVQVATDGVGALLGAADVAVLADAPACVAQDRGRSA